jgi:hypothetical protein
MNYLFLIISYYFYHSEYKNGIVYGKHVIYGIEPNYKEHFEYPKNCNQSIMINLSNINDIKSILNMGWNNTTNGFDFWKEEYTTRYDFEVNMQEYDYFINYLIYHNEFMNVSNNFNKKMYELEVMDYLAEENDIFYYPEYKRISKTKYNKININYDILYLNNYFNPFNQQTITSKNIVEVWKCSI